MSLAEARRILTICTVCNYCNGLCETFRAVERRRDFSDGDLVYLAHLCHNCGNCLPACQYAPPHPFAVNVPKTLAEVRKRSWRDRPWLALACVVLTPALALFLVPWDVLFARHAGPGAFYAILPWPALAAAATVPLVFSAALLTSGILRFWRESGGGRAWKALPAALSDALTLTKPSRRRSRVRTGRRPALLSQRAGLRFRLVFRRDGGGCHLSSCLGLAGALSDHQRACAVGDSGRVRHDRGVRRIGLAQSERRSCIRRGAEGLFLFGLAVRRCCHRPRAFGFARTQAMGLLLATHLGCVVGLFATLAYGKFAHAPYRLAALSRAAMERKGGSL